MGTMSHARLHWSYRLAVIGVVIAQAAMMGQGPRVMVPLFLVNLVATFLLARKLHRPFLTLTVLLPILPVLVALLPEKASPSLESGLRAASPPVSRSSAAPSLQPKNPQAAIQSPAARGATAAAAPQPAETNPKGAGILAAPLEESPGPLVDEGAVRLMMDEATVSEDVRSLVENLRHGDEAGRFKAAQALGESKQRAVVPFLIHALVTDKVDGVRWAAVEALGAIGDGRAVDYLIATLYDQDQDWRVRRAAVERLRIFGEKRAIGPLIAALLDPDSKVQAEALGALRTLDKRPSMQDLIRSTVSSIEIPGQARGEGVWALALGAGAPRALSALRRSLTPERVSSLKRCHEDHLQELQVVPILK